MKSVQFLGGCQKAAKKLPDDVKNDMGHQLTRVALGLDPDNWKPMPRVGCGVKEIKVKADTGEYRAIYIAKDDVVNVLHVFKKKSKKTLKVDIELAQERLSNA